MNDLLETNPQPATIGDITSATEFAEIDRGALDSPDGSGTDTVTVDKGQLVDTAILSDLLRVPLPNVSPDTNALGPQRMEQIDGRRHAAVDVVLADGCGAEKQEPPIAHEE